MINTSFDIAFWSQWRTTLFWFVNILGFITTLSAYGQNFNRKANTTAISVIVMLIMLILLGFYPIEWGSGTDRVNYAHEFLSINAFGNHSRLSDYGFSLLTEFLGSFLNVKLYFVALTVIYLANYFIAIRKMVSLSSFWLIVAVLVSMGFVSYAINTTRSGLALSFIVLSLAYYPSKLKMAFCVIIASSIHYSAIIPGIILMICTYYSNTRLFYKLWLLAIPLSFVAGGLFTRLFANISSDARVGYLTTTNTHYNIGFRIDFILYSFAPLAVGAYYIFKKGFNDKFYTMIYNTYVLTNLFWILVIRANFSDRFAYLSWFLMPFVLVYPLLKHKMALRENVWLATIILGETIFGMLI